ncbi:MAG: Flp pilus assembly complex ATPase component TadA [Armatimonadetes bacterium]|nr:Flp pilus assembly complex ATPase component TadA [Anaerolineae bacterium]
MTIHNGSDPNDDFTPDESPNPKPARRRADTGREPTLMPGHLGTRLVSLAALVERIVAAFEQEHDITSPEMMAAHSQSDQLRLLRDTTQYVLAVESMVISPEEQADIMRRAHAELFGYGPLDAFFADSTVTTISIEGADKASVRYGHGDLVMQPPLFEDQAQLQRIIGRLLKRAHAAIQPDYPYLETGFTLNGRPMSLSLVLPPVTPLLTADLRLHPAQLPPLESFVDSEAACTLLTAIAQSPHGLVVVGEAESGKTTLLAMLAALSGQAGIMSVERAGELRLPADAVQHKVQWAVGDDQPNISFAEQIAAVLAQAPACILLDEVRADEPGAILPLLSAVQPPRQMWAFRGPAESKRLASALGMLARRGDATHSEALVGALYRQLPFVIVVRRREGRLHLHSINEWQFAPGADYPDYVALMERGWDGIALTGKRPAQGLALPEAFWAAPPSQ